jgi:hypothetical protein
MLAHTCGKNYKYPSGLHLYLFINKKYKYFRPNWAFMYAYGPYLRIVPVTLYDCNIITVS